RSATKLTNNSFAIIVIQGLLEIGRMNVGRGLFRGWILLTVLWLIGASAVAYFIIGDEISRWKWQYDEIMRDEDMPPWETDWKRPYCENMRSPSAEKLAVSFEKLGYSSWNKYAEEEGRIVIIKMPDQGDAPDFVEIGEAGVAVIDAMRHQHCVQLVG